jgi:acyl-coenzyme A thioesterase 13
MAAKLATGYRLPQLATRVSSSTTDFARSSHQLTTYAVGKTLAYTTVSFRNGKGELAARGSHTK